MQTDPSDISSFERIELDALQSPVVRQGVSYWIALRGTRRFPTRNELHPRGFATILSNVLLIKAIDEGDDFEFRVVGDAQAQTYAVPFAGKRLSELRGTSPAYGHSLHGLFSHVVQFAEPVALRAQFGSGIPNVKIAYCETAFLPLGTDDKVDHLLGFTAFVNRTP